MPKPKDPLSPIKPIHVGINPPPMVMDMGKVNETDMFLTLGGPIPDNAENPAGKKELAINGCINIMAITTLAGATPIVVVAKHPRKNTHANVFFDPKRSLAQPAKKMVPMVGSLDREKRKFTKL